MKAQFNDSVHPETPLTTLLHLLFAQAQASEHGLMMSSLAPTGPQISPLSLFAVIKHMIKASIQLMDNWDGMSLAVSYYYSL